MTGPAKVTRLDASNPQVARIAELRAQGWSLRRIGRATGHSYEAVRLWVKKAQCGKTSSRAPYGKVILSEAQRARLLAMNADGYSLDGIAAELGVSREWVRQELKKCGAPPRRCGKRSGIPNGPPRKQAVRPALGPNWDERPPLPPMHPISWGVINAGLASMLTPQLLAL